MPHQDKNSTLPRNNLPEDGSFNPLAVSLRRAIQAKAFAAQDEALATARRATWRRVLAVAGRIGRAAIEFWNIPVLGPSDGRR